MATLLAAAVDEVKSISGVKASPVTDTTPSSRNAVNSFLRMPRISPNTPKNRRGQRHDGHGDAGSVAPGGHAGNAVRRAACHRVKEDGQNGHDDDRVGAVGPVVHHPADLLLGKFFYKKPIGRFLPPSYYTHGGCVYKYCTMRMPQTQHTPSAFSSAGCKTFVIFLWQVVHRRKGSPGGELAPKATEGWLGICSCSWVHPSPAGAGALLEGSLS